MRAETLDSIYNDEWFEVFEKLREAVAPEDYEALKKWYYNLSIANDMLLKFLNGKVEVNWDTTEDRPRFTYI
jgi:hypothetical protein